MALRDAIIGTSASILLNNADRWLTEGKDFEKTESQDGLAIFGALSGQLSQDYPDVSSNP